MLLLSLLLRYPEHTQAESLAVVGWLVANQNLGGGAADAESQAEAAY